LGTSSDSRSEPEKHKTIPRHVRYAHEVRLQNILIQYYTAVVPYFGNSVVKQFRSRIKPFALKRLTLLLAMQDWMRRHRCAIDPVVVAVGRSLPGFPGRRTGIVSRPSATILP
jgi:hypothetical protein